MSALRQWLELHGLAEHAELLEKNDVDFDLLPFLNDTDLEKLGLSLGHRKRLLLAIGELGASGSLPTPPATVVPDDAPLAANDNAATPASAPGLRQPELRHLTVMFSDLVGSTALSERMDPEDLLRLLRAYQQASSQVIARHDGHIAHYRGDGLMVYFGWPRAREDDAERAVRAGLEIVRAIKQIHAPVPLRVRIGIATGQAMIVQTGDGDATISKDALGPTPNIAARLQAMAEPDQIVIAGTTHRLLGQRYECEDLGEKIIRGLSGRQRVWRVTGERSAVSRFDAVHGLHGLTPLCGRHSELQLLQGRWQLARQGHGQAVLLQGEPGIGKSRLLRALRDHVAAGPHTLIACECARYFRNSALHPVIEQLKRAANFGPDDSAEDKLLKLQALLPLAGNAAAGVMQFLRTLLALPVDAPLATETMTPRQQRQETYRALEERLAGLARIKPMLLIVEDLHWADPSTLEFLGGILERVSTWPALVVISFRPEFEPPWPRHEHVGELALGRLGREESMHMMRELADRKALPGVLLEQIAVKTDGVPLFIEELTRSMLEAGNLRDEGDRYVLAGALTRKTVPNTLSDLLMERLDRLSAIKDIVQTCAAIGREFSFDFLQAVSSAPEARLRDALARLMDARLAHRRADATTESYAFNHALIQDAAYATLLRGERQALHARIAQAIEQRIPETVSQHPELLAYHHSQAGNMEIAIRFAGDASLSALQRSSYVETIAHAREALNWLPAILDTGERTRTEIQLNALITPAMMVHFGYASEELEKITHRSLQLIDALGDAPAIFPALWALEVYHHVRSNRVQAREIAQRFVDLAERSEDQGQLTAGLPLLAQCQWIEGDYQGALTTLRRGIALYDADAHGAHGMRYGIDSLSYCLLTLSQVEWALGDAEAALVRAQDAVAHARHLKHANTIGLASLFLMMVHQQRNERQRVEELGREMLEFCERYGVETPRSYARMIHNWAIGDVDASLRIIRMHRSSKAELGLTYYASLTAESAAAAGRCDEALELLRDCIDQALGQGERYYLPELHRLHGCVLLQRDPAAREAARASFDKALAEARLQASAMHAERAAAELRRLSEPAAGERAAGSLPAAAVRGSPSGLL